MPFTSGDTIHDASRGSDRNFGFPQFFERNRVFRVYTGGKLFHDFFGDEPIDGNLPEEWIASRVRALNKESKSPDEGLSTLEGGSTTFASLLAQDIDQMTGGKSFDVLVKILDSAVRLPMQAHPDPSFSRKYFNSSHGKTECWIILGTRPGAKLYFGFKEGVTEQDLRSAVQQDEERGRNALAGLLQEVEATVGDVWLIPARVAHAIGAGCLILEVQEPTDFTIQPERWCDQYQLSDEEMYLGLDREVALSCFDLKQSGAPVLDRGKKQSQITEQTDAYSKESLISSSDTPCFSVNRYLVNSSCPISNAAIYVVTKGKGELICNSLTRPIQKGSYFFVPYAAPEVLVRSMEGLELIECLPPVDVAG